MFFHWFLVVILEFSTVFGGVKHRRVVRQAGSNTCLDANNRTGLCVPIGNCTQWLNLMKNSILGPAAIRFLRQSQCEIGIWKDHQSRICCSSDGMLPSFLTNNPSSPTFLQTTMTSTKEITTSTASPASTNRPINWRCGRSDKIVDKIVGGKNSTLGDWPWMAALGYRNASNSIQFLCGGSLISNRWVVTAAHCIVNNARLNLTTVRLGDLDLNDHNDDGATPQDFPIEQNILYPYYTSGPIRNDIALLKLKNDVTFTRLIRPICILSGAQHRSDTFYNKKFPFIVGWGAKEWRGPMQTHLQDTQVKTVDNQLCARNYSKHGSAVIDQRVICAGDDGEDTCQGDSGGPLILAIGGTYYLSGVTSFGVRCADKNYPGVYTRVAYFSDWIKNITGIELQN